MERMQAEVASDLTAELGMLMGDAIGVRAALVMGVAHSQHTHQASGADLSAGFRAASEVLTYLDDFQSAWQDAVREITSLPPSELRRVYRRYQMRFWQTSPQFLRAR